VRLERKEGEYVGWCPARPHRARPVASLERRWNEMPVRFAKFLEVMNKAQDRRKRKLFRLLICQMINYTCNSRAGARAVAGYGRELIE
jgi:hypothetical protein